MVRRYSDKINDKYSNALLSQLGILALIPLLVGRIVLTLIVKTFYFFLFFLSTIGLTVRTILSINNKNKDLFKLIKNLLKTYKLLELSVKEFFSPHREKFLSIKPKRSFTIYKKPFQLSQKRLQVVFKTLKKSNALVFGLIKNLPPTYSINKTKLDKLIKLNSKKLSKKQDIVLEKLVFLKLLLANKLRAKASLQFAYLYLKASKLTSRIKKTRRVKLKFPIALAIFFVLILSPFTAGYLFVKSLPSVTTLQVRDQEQSTKIYDRHGYLLYNVYKDENRTVIPLSEIPTHAKLATLAAEDAEFYTHPGISFRGMLRSLMKNIQNDELASGSTITQQLIKNTLLTPEKTITRKAKEVVLALQVERQFSKDEILEMYLNEVSYGGTAYGLQEATRLYFDKDAKNLTLAEAALLAGLPKSPTIYSPFGLNPDLSLTRQKTVLKQMEINGFIGKEERIKAEQEKIKFAQNRIEIRAPHFVMWTKENLEKELGVSTLETGGLEVITTLDYEIQKMAEEVVASELDSLSRLNVGNASVVVMNPTNGEVLAMVGSRDYFDTANDGNVNAALALRQPGSSIKVVNYAYALSHGFTPASIIDDTKTSFSIRGQPVYTPVNYDGRFRGKITLRSALAESRNIPAVKVLNSYGVSNMIDLGTRMGVTTWEDRSRFGLSLTLGGGEVRLIDLAQVYATLANYGTRHPVKSISKITKNSGELLHVDSCSNLETKSRFKITAADVSASEVSARENCESETVLDERVTYLITDILKDNNARTPAFGRHSQLVISNHPEVAVKTGTSNDLRDNLTVGYSQDYVVAVWVGNNDNAPMSRIASGITGASSIFNKVMTNLLKNKSTADWRVPAGVVNVPICSITGTLPCEGCPTRNEVFLEETTPKFACRPETITAQAKSDNSESNNEREREFN